jgi:outer membrane lipoprotein SlyB
MKRTTIFTFALVATLAAGCADTGSFGGGPRYGESGTETAQAQDRYGNIVSVETVQVDDQYRLGVGTAVGAVAGAILGRQVGGGRGRDVATVVGAAAGAAAGTVAESKLKKQTAQRVVVRMATGGEVTILQPVDDRLRQGMNVIVQGSGESARVAPR